VDGGVFTAWWWWWWEEEEEEKKKGEGRDGVVSETMVAYPLLPLLLLLLLLLRVLPACHHLVFIERIPSQTTCVPTC